MVAPCAKINILITNIRMSGGSNEELIIAVEEIKVLFAEINRLKAEVTRAQTILNSAIYTRQGIDSATAAKGTADALLQKAVENVREKIVAAENLLREIQTRAPGSQAGSPDISSLIAALQQLGAAAPGSVGPAAASVSAPASVGAPASVSAAAAPPASLLVAAAPPAPPAPAAALAGSVAMLPPGKQESFLTRITEFAREVVAPTAVAVVGVRNSKLFAIAFCVLIIGLFVVNVVTTSSRSKKKHKGGASTLKRSLSLNLLKSKSISSEKKQIGGRVFNTLLKEAELKYPGVISFSKKMDPELFNLEVNKLSKILTRNEIISLASQIFGTEIIQRIIKLVNSGKSVRMNTIRNRKNMYKENNYYPSASIAI